MKNPSLETSWETYPKQRQPQGICLHRCITSIDIISKMQAVRSKRTPYGRGLPSLHPSLQPIKHPDTSKKLHQMTGSGRLAMLFAMSEPLRKEAKWQGGRNESLT